jgi:regulator of sirC expression with transglutaminase-like and TPR domain
MVLSFPNSPEFVRLVAGNGNLKVARIALEIAVDAYPDLEIDTYLSRIQALAERIRARCRPRAKVRDILGQINWVLFVEEEIRGNREEYYDPRNSYLNEVIDRRLGIPISLSVLYWAVAEQIGLSISGVNLPLHFMLRAEDDGQPWFVDPFNAGAIYDRENCQRKLGEIAERPMVLTDSMIEPASIQTVVTRMLRNLKAIYAQTQDFSLLLPVQRRLTALNLDEPAEMRTLGVLCVQLQRLGEAVDPLQGYLDMEPQSDDAGEIRDLLKVIRRQLAEWN